jgi:HipA-like protein
MPLSARRYLRKMRGGAQSHLLEADDGRFYIVKFQNNPQHRRILVNEWISSIFLKYLQISSAEAAIVRIDDEFIRRHQQLAITLGTRSVPVEPGWHFGSLHPGDPERVAVYDFVPDALLSQVKNLADFLAILVFDKWVSNADGRQSVFFRARLEEWRSAGGKMGFVALMIDHGFAFNGPHWNFTDSPLMGLYPRRMVYESVRSLDDFQPWLDQVVHFPEEVFDSALKQVPPEWIEGEEEECERMLERLLARRRLAPELISETHRSKANPFPNWR